jgi:hypothetical protein
MSRQCVFCENPADSKEHIFPQWVLQLATSRTRTVEGDFRNKSFRYSGPNADFQVRCLCERCNTGWLSQFEGHASGLMKPLIKDEGLNSLSPNTQSVIAGWMIKLAMLADATRVDARPFYTAKQRYEFARGRLPTLTLVDLARRDLSDGDDHLVLIGRNLFDEHAEVAHFLQTTTIAIFHLVGQVTTVGFPEPRSGEVSFRMPLQRADWEALTLRIGPPSTEAIDWPPRTSLGPETITLDTLEDRWTGTPAHADTWPDLPV